jgi:hypothetical protein
VDDFLALEDQIASFVDVHLNALGLRQFIDLRVGVTGPVVTSLLILGRMVNLPTATYRIRAP